MLEDADTAVAAFHAVSEGVFRFDLIVNDGELASDPATFEVTVNGSNQVPIADAGRRSSEGVPARNSASTDRPATTRIGGIRSPIPGHRSRGLSLPFTTRTRQHPASPRRTPESTSSSCVYPTGRHRAHRTRYSYVSETSRRVVETTEQIRGPCILAPNPIVSRSAPFPRIPSYKGSSMFKRFQSPKGSYPLSPDRRRHQVPPVRVQPRGVGLRAGIRKALRKMRDGAGGLGRPQRF